MYDIFDTHIQLTPPIARFSFFQQFCVSLWKYLLKKKKTKKPPQILVVFDEEPYQNFKVVVVVVKKKNIFCLSDQKGIAYKSNKDIQDIIVYVCKYIYECHNDKRQALICDEIIIEITSDVN